MEKYPVLVLNILLFCELFHGVNRMSLESGTLDYLTLSGPMFVDMHSHMMKWMSCLLGNFTGQGNIHSLNILSCDF